MSIYSLSTLGTSSNNLILNNFGVFPLFKAQRRLPTQRELNQYDIVLPQGDGIADFQSFIAKEYFIIEGTMYPQNEEQFHNGRAQIRKVASMAIAQNDPLADEGYVPYQWMENVGKQLFVKVEYVNMEENTKIGLKQPFQFLCKVKYPAILSQTLTTVDTGVIPSSGTAGSSPLSFPLGKVLGSTIYNVSNNANNVGDLPSYPVSITITGPVNNPVLSNVTTGEFIGVNVNLPTAADTLVIQYDQNNTSVTQGGNNVYGSLVGGSTFFQIQPGNNQIQLNGSSISNGAHATLTFYSAWPLS